MEVQEEEIGCRGGLLKKTRFRPEYLPLYWGAIQDALSNIPTEMDIFMEGLK
jgi:hypothetical protein